MDSVKVVVGEVDVVEVEDLQGQRTTTFEMGGNALYYVQSSGIYQKRPFLEACTAHVCC